MAKFKPSLKKFLGASAVLALLAGCGGHSHSDSGKLIFKGQIAKVEFMLTRGITLLIDAEGKTTELTGFPAVPCAEVEIYAHGSHEYQVFQAQDPFAAP